MHKRIKPGSLNAEVESIDIKIPLVCKIWASCLLLSYNFLIVVCLN